MFSEEKFLTDLDNADFNYSISDSNVVFSIQPFPVEPVCTEIVYNHDP